MFKILTLIFIALLFTSCEKQTETGWNEDVVYFVLIDRFSDGDKSNNDGGVPASYKRYLATNPEALKHYQGGDLRGIIENLNLIQGMGFTTIWLSPFLDNSNTDYVGWWPYHGYHPIDFKSVDEHFGTLDDLKELVNDVHERKMKIIFDMPFNQVAADHPWLNDPQKQDWFHWDSAGQPFEITDWHDQVQIERGELHGLPDLAQENEDVYQYLLEVSQYWIQETGCDGFRLDAVKHAPLDFWKRFNQDIKAFAGEDFLLLGEVFWGEVERIEPYLGSGFDALFDIPGYYAIRNVFANNASMDEFSKYVQTSFNTLQPELRATLIDNHDVARFNTRLGKQGWLRERAALMWLLTSPGMPVLYYGTDIGMEGAPVKDSITNEPSDYLNRRMYPKRVSIRENAHRLETSTLIGMRKIKPALRIGDFHELYKDWSVYAYLRSEGEETFLVVLTTSSMRERLSIPIPQGMPLETDPLKMWGEGSARSMEDGIYLSLPPFAAVMWQLSEPVPAGLPQWVSFTDRKSGDYQTIELSWQDLGGEIQTLEIAGSFNNWQPTSYPTRREEGVLYVSLPLKTGDYEYKFVLNGETWTHDPSAHDSSVDPYGGTNSIIHVGQSAVQGKTLD